jgi:hypothetical protein
MPNDMRDDDKPSRGFRFSRTPLFRLLAINLASGIAVAVLLVGGLLLLDPGGLRHLIFADRTPGIALGLLLFGFIVTFGSAAMGSAIMAAGLREGDENEPRGPRRLAAQEFSRRGKTRKRAHLSTTWKKHGGHGAVAPLPTLPATR